MDERAVTEAGNPGNPQGAYGEKMLERMNRSHADVTMWALDQLAYKAQERALDIGCGGGATMERLARRIAAAGGAGHVSGIDHSEVSCEASRHYNKDAIEALQQGCHRGRTDGCDLYLRRIAALPGRFVRYRDDGRELLFLARP
jgi:SAM-dependent methyltransferase